MQNGPESNEWCRIWVHRTSKIVIQKRGPNHWGILKNWFLPKIRSPLFNLKKFENPDRSTPESYKMDWKLIHGEEFGSKKLLKLKSRRGDQIVQKFCKVGLSQKLGPANLICRNLKTLKEVLLNHKKMHWKLINVEELESKRLSKL